MIGRGPVLPSCGTGRRIGVAKVGGSVGTAWENGSFSQVEICVADSTTLALVFLREDVFDGEFFIH